MTWTQPKRFEPDQNNLYLSKSIWTVKTHFGPIEGQGIIEMEWKTPHFFKLSIIEIEKCFTHLLKAYGSIFFLQK